MKLAVSRAPSEDHLKSEGVKVVGRSGELCGQRDHLIDFIVGEIVAAKLLVIGNLALQICAKLRLVRRLERDGLRDGPVSIQGLRRSLLKKRDAQTRPGGGVVRCYADERLVGVGGSLPILQAVVGRGDHGVKNSGDILLLLGELIVGSVGRLLPICQILQSLQGGVRAPVSCGGELSSGNEEPARKVCARARRALSCEVRSSLSPSDNSLSMYLIVFG